MRRLILALLGLVVLAVGAAVVVFVIRGSDEPPPPSLSTGDAGDEPAPAPSGSGRWEVAGGEETFVGYRVRERFATVGVVDAVGRTGEVIGTFRIDGDRVETASMEANLASLRSDESRRDQALADRGIETARFPTASFELAGPFAIARTATKAKGELTLHGETQPITATVRGQRVGDGVIELVGEAPIDFPRFGIEPPSVAGFVTVRDEGTLEFKLRLRAA
jgi:polyisoprenoid-binding protein YceI